MGATADRPAQDAGKGAQRGRDAARALFGRSRTLHGALGFWQKINNDWVFNLSGLLAYNLLMAIFPILLVLLAISGIVVGRLSPVAYANLTASIGTAIPGGKGVVRGVTRQLADSAGLLLLIGLLAALVTGSRLFISMEKCFAVIFRVRSREPLHQNLMAFGMLLLFIVLVPIITLGSVAPAAIVRALDSGAPHGVGGFVAQALGLVASAVLAAVLFAAIYLVVPNRRMRPREIWRGVVVAAALLALYEALFPLYESNVLRAGNYGHVAGYVVIVLVYFYYFALILLLGAEVNAWAAGERQTEGDIAHILRAARQRSE